MQSSDSSGCRQDTVASLKYNHAFDDVKDMTTPAALVVVAFKHGPFLVFEDIVRDIHQLVILKCGCVHCSYGFTPNEGCPWYKMVGSEVGIKRCKSVCIIGIKRFEPAMHHSFG